MAITKKDIIDAIHSKFGMTRQESVKIVDSLFEIIKEKLANGNDVMISGFGRWSVRKRKAGACRNPQTGESMHTNERIVVTFRNSLRLKENVNREKIKGMEGEQLMYENKSIYSDVPYLKTDEVTNWEQSGTMLNENGLYKDTERRS
jgi:integration host factor subunit alpha